MVGLRRKQMMSAEKADLGLSRSSVWPSHDPSRCLSRGWPRFKLR